MLERVEETLAAIKTKLQNSTTIRKLLFHSSNDALQLEAPELKQFGDKYIVLKPVFEFENKEDYTQNSIINVFLAEMQPAMADAKTLNGVIQINIICNSDVWELTDNKVRPISIANAVIKLVNNAKFSVSNKLVFDTMTDLIINKKMYGYALLFDMTDGNSDIDKF